MDERKAGGRRGSSTAGLGEAVSQLLSAGAIVLAYMNFGYLLEKPTLGFSEGRPYSKAGAPAVPENQTVFASFPNDHTVVYRSVAEGCTAGEWQVFCHHGAGYAIAEWPHPASLVRLTMLSTAVHVLADAPFPIFPDMPVSWPAFYWRCRWTGDPSRRDVPVERLEFNLERCLR